MANSRVIEVVSSTSDDAGRFKNLIRVTLTANGETISVAGTLLPDKGSRIVEIDEHPVDIEPQGSFLFIGHSDKPGMIGKVGTALGNNDANIQRMEVAREKE